MDAGSFSEEICWVIPTFTWWTLFRPYGTRGTGMQPWKCVTRASNTSWSCGENLLPDVVGTEGLVGGGQGRSWSRGTFFMFLEMKTSRNDRTRICFIFVWLILWVGLICSVLTSSPWGCWRAWPCLLLKEEEKQACLALGIEEVEIQARKAWVQLGSLSCSGCSQQLSESAGCLRCSSSGAVVPQTAVSPTLATGKGSEPSRFFPPQLARPMPFSTYSVRNSLSKSDLLTLRAK